jgi:Domain of unknown function (DUF4411)
MSYVFDNSPLSVLFRNFYRRTFRSLWERFDELVANGEIVSTREALREIEDGAPNELLEWAQHNGRLFAAPTAAEGAFVGKIYAMRHFQQNIEQQKLLKGGKNADPFVIARAAVEGRAVVTMEQLKPNAAKIPNICQHLGIECLTLEQFMHEEEWEF